MPDETFGSVCCAAHTLLLLAGCVLMFKIPGIKHHKSLQHPRALVTRSVEVSC